ncbi:MAG: TfoX/Sxy family protein [Chitinophagales bacterium]|nr:TfoX/Sxy family protein [Bacteroidota bacterium]MCB9042693.1 TfoX/Sxy family protein [Chitinophagales bacterium]
MAYNQQLAQLIGEQLLARQVNFETKKMFGGLAFMIKEKMCLGILQNEMIVRVMPEDYDTFLASSHFIKPMDFTGKIMRGFIMVEDEGIDALLQVCIEKALVFAEKGTLRSRKKFKPK